MVQGSLIHTNKNEEILGDREVSVSPKIETTIRSGFQLTSHSMFAGEFSIDSEEELCLMTGLNGVLYTMGNASTNSGPLLCTGKRSGLFSSQWGLCKLIFYGAVLRFGLLNLQSVIGQDS